MQKIFPLTWQRLMTNDLIKKDVQKLKKREKKLIKYINK